MRILILAGTAEARALAVALAADHEVIASYLSAEARTPQGVRTRHGGFGGARGLARYIAAHAIDAVIDATHPFAARISANAVSACAATPLLRLERPGWSGPWRRFADLGAALCALPAGARPLAALGAKEAARLAERPDLSFTLRAITPVDTPANVTLVLARPGGSPDEERAALTAARATHLLCRDSGGAGAAKLTAATALGVEVFLIDRPPPSAAYSVATVDAARDWVEEVALAQRRDGSVS